MESTEIVQWVVDGDTFETQGTRSPIRLEGVDAPEVQNYLGREARAHLIQLMADRKVIVDLVGYDNDGRRLAYVKCNGLSVNRAMNKYLADALGDS